MENKNAEWRDRRLWKSDQGDGTFTNPVLFADYSDPDAVRVGDTYYLTASSFNYTPGLPILVSKDLVNWRLANYALKNIPEERYRIPRHSEGVWAPSIRCRGGLFYITYGMPDEGIYVVRARDPLGDWDEPVCVLAGKGLIDPCPFWDADGRAFLVHGYARSRIGFKSCLGIFEMDPEGMRAVSEDHILYDGTRTQPTIEGPKVHFRNGYTYIFAPAGGVTTGWQTVLRARDIHGPFEERIVMRQGDSPVGGPHQGALLDAPESGAAYFPGGGSEDLPGRQYFLHFQDRGLYGRIVHVQPVRWEDDWPVIGEAPSGDTGVNAGRAGSPGSLEDISEARGKSAERTQGFACGQPVFRLEIPVRRGDAPVYLEASDDFSGGTLGLQWQWFGNHEESFYALPGKEDGRGRDGRSPGDANGGEGAPGAFLRLYARNPAGEENVPLWREANVLTQKIVCPYFAAEVRMDAGGLQDGDTAGVIVTGGSYLFLGVRRDGERRRIVLGRAREAGKIWDETVMEEDVEALAEVPEGSAPGRFASNASDAENPDRPAEAPRPSGEPGEIRFRVEMRNTEPGAEPFGSGKPEFAIFYALPEGPEHVPQGSGEEKLVTSGRPGFVRVQTDFTPSDHTWVGAKLGLFAHSGRAEGSAGYADFREFTVTADEGDGRTARDGAR